MAVAQRFQKRFFSTDSTGSGRLIGIYGTASPWSTAIHSIPATDTVTSQDVFSDEMWIYATNHNPSLDVEVTILWAQTAAGGGDGHAGGLDTGDSGSIIRVTLAKMTELSSNVTSDGLVLVIPGIPIGPGVHINAYASEADSVVIYGYANRITSLVI
jgi:hypothetical protein